MNNEPPPRRYVPWIGIVFALIVIAVLVIIRVVRADLQGDVMHTGAQAAFTAPNHGGVGQASSPLMEDQALNGRNGATQGSSGSSGVLNGTTEPAGGAVLPPGPKIVGSSSKSGATSSKSGATSSKSGSPGPKTSR